MLLVMIIPLILIGVIITINCCRQMKKSIHQEVELGLRSTAHTALYMYEKEFPGEYRFDSATSTLYKGNRKVEDVMEILDTYKKISGADVTVFYRNMRVATTIRDDTGEPIVGTRANQTIKKEVLDGRQERFYTSTQINGEDYFSYYCPIHDDNNECIGMIFAGKSSQYVSEIVLKGVMPIVTIILISVTVMVLIIWFYSDKLVKILRTLQDFLKKAEGGNLTAELGRSVVGRRDELGQIGKSAVQMQISLRELIERDSLTGLYNRHYGEEWLARVQREAIEVGDPFYVSIGDIDFFKKFNDSFGHDCGDQVLREVSAVLRKKMYGKGYVARWGGEEFLLIILGKRVDDAVHFINQVAEEVRTQKIDYAGQFLGVTMTFGVTDGAVDRHMDELIKCADQALYEGKETGRNKVVYRSLPNDSEAATWMESPDNGSAALQNKE